ncbi:IS1249 family transposase [Mobiluncus mulieris]|nr:IS1249 family transposase [Mobiluncus mulieris]MCV0002671.1 IS1249 family transposase [Mobiluncus mulieris]
MKTNRKACPECGKPMVKNGHDKRGVQRWRCPECRITGRWGNDVTARDLTFFLEFILGKNTHRDLPGQGRTFRRKAARLWELWPIWIPDGEAHRVIHVDGIYLRRIVVVLIAYSDRHVVGWHIARKETTQAYKDLLSKIPPPQLMLCDGGTGFASARRACWKTTRVQRCLFHVFCNIKSYTSTKSKSPAGRELYRLAKQLLAVKTTIDRDKWIVDFYTWTKKYEDFLAEKTLTDTGKYVDTHERLVKARNLLIRLIKKGEMFTFLEPDLYSDNERVGCLPRTNNPIEGGVNTQLRSVLRAHRGMGINHQLRAIAWWCYLHTQSPESPAELLRLMPTKQG